MSAQGKDIAAYGRTILAIYAIDGGGFALAIAAAVAERKI